MRKPLNEKINEKKIPKSKKIILEMISLQKRVFLYSIFLYQNYFPLLYVSLAIFFQKTILSRDFKYDKIY